MTAVVRTVVLVHGYLAVLGRLGVESGHYFRGLVPALEAMGLQVFAPQLPIADSVARRSQQLAAALAAIPAQGGRDLCVLAHSMGGLDMRQVLHDRPDLAQRVHSLVCLGTPFAGSELADVLSTKPASLPLRWRELAENLLSPLGAGLEDLTTWGAAQLSARCDDPPGIHRFTVLGQPPMWLGFWPASPLGGLSRLAVFKGQPNDGLVGHASARRAGFDALPDWPVDHIGLVGWGELLPSAHLARYRKLVADVCSRPPA